MLGINLIVGWPMWRSWSKSSPNTTPTSSSSSSTSSSKPDFRCSSFKDIHDLCLPSDAPRSSPSPAAKRLSIFHRVRTANALLRHWAPPRSHDPNARIVIYYTTLRVVRSTFEACRAVQSILQGFRVAIDERDLAMDSAFISELQELLGTDADLTLPRVFIGGRYIGGAEEVKELNEVGELKKMIAGLQLAKSGTCDICGGYRFILCTQCSGSHKVFTNKTGFRTCTACNENGLTRCPECYSPPPTRPILPPINTT